MHCLAFSFGWSWVGKAKFVSLSSETFGWLSEEADSPSFASYHSSTHRFSAANLPNAASRSSDMCGGWIRFSSGIDSASEIGRSLQSLLAEVDDLGTPEVVGVKLSCFDGRAAGVEPLDVAV